jgi:hypothetical protein
VPAEKKEKEKKEKKERGGSLELSGLQVQNGTIPCSPHGIFKRGAFTPPALLLPS